MVTKGLESGIRNDAPDAAIAMRQKVISLYIYFFKYRDILGDGK